MPECTARRMAILNKMWYKSFNCKWLHVFIDLVPSATWRILLVFSFSSSFIKICWKLNGSRCSICYGTLKDQRACGSIKPYTVHRSSGFCVRFRRVFMGITWQLYFMRIPPNEFTTESNHCPHAHARYNVHRNHSKWTFFTS